MTGHGLGNRAALLRRRTTCFSCYCVFCPADPSRPVPGHGLGNRVALLSHRIRFFSCSFLFRPAEPPRGAGGALGNFATPTVAQDYVIFLLFGGWPRPPSLRWWRYFGFSIFRRHVSSRPSLPGDMAVGFIGDFSPLRIGFLSFPFYLAFLVGQASLFRGVGLGFEEPHL